MKLISRNKHAYHDYQVLETLEVGIVLTGDEVKSIRAGNISMVGSFAHIYQGELYLVNCRIAVYKQAFEKSEELAARRRKLLLHRKELARLVGDISRKGITVVPLSIYFNNRSFIKIELGLCKHKKAEGKKKELQERDIRRETAREMKDRR